MCVVIVIYEGHTSTYQYGKWVSIVKKNAILFMPVMHFVPLCQLCKDIMCDLSGNVCFDVSLKELKQQHLPSVWVEAENRQIQLGVLIVYCGLLGTGYENI